MIGKLLLIMFGVVFALGIVTAIVLKDDWESVTSISRSIVCEKLAGVGKTWKACEHIPINNIDLTETDIKVDENSDGVVRVLNG